MSKILAGRPRTLVAMGHIRFCRNDERNTILAIVNAAAQAYRGVIPADRWHDPYMPAEELHREIGAGVTFWGYEVDGDLVGVMGVQLSLEVDLIRHAYVLPAHQRHGVGAALIEHIRSESRRPMLVGTWAAASWAIDFYRRHGFVLVSPQRRVTLLKTHWSIPDRQIAVSVVLANPPLEEIAPRSPDACDLRIGSSSRAPPRRQMTTEFALSAT